MSAAVDIAGLVRAYHKLSPDPASPSERVAFGTSGHRGSSIRKTFNEAHVLAMTQAIAEFRARSGVAGPLFLGADTHALSAPAIFSALEVLAGNSVETVVSSGMKPVPTPAVSHAILAFNRAAEGGGRRADGIVVTPSHNPPEDGGLKYNPPHGGPAGTDATKAIETRANEILASDLRGVKRVPVERARRAPTTSARDFVGPYVEDLGSVVDMDAVRSAGTRIGADPMGGASLAYWTRIAERWRLSLEVVNPRLDPTFSFMPKDHDGKIRMDCSSPHAMAGLIGLKDRFDVAFGNDPDADRHGVVCRSAGLMNPNHYLAVMGDYLFRERTEWPEKAGIGKTLVSSSMIDRVAKALGRKLVEVPVGFKWFVDGLLSGALGFGGEESAGASFLRRDGTVWTTDKDGIVPNLLAAEITARTGDDPGRRYAALEAKHGSPVYERIDAPAEPEEKAALLKLSPGDVSARELAGERITAVLTSAPGNGAPIGGLKVAAENGWFAARPSGTEPVYKIYAESFRDRDHLARIKDEAKAIVSAAFRAAGI